MLGLTLFVTLCGVTQALYCNPRKYEYNRKSTPNECGKCDVCVIGEGKISLQESGIHVDPEFGSRACIPCRPCKKNTFSGTRSNDCQRCTNCTALNKQTTKPCTTENDAVCGGPLPVVTEFPEVTTSVSIHKDDTDTEMSTLMVVVLVVSPVAVVLLAILIAMAIKRFICRRNPIEGYGMVSQTSDIEVPQSGNDVHNSRTRSTNRHEPAVLQNIDETKELKIPGYLKFERPKNEYSSGTSTDDEQKPLLKRKRMKRRSSLPARISRHRNSYYENNITQYNDITEDSPQIGDGQNTRLNKVKTVPKLMRSLSYPCAQREKPQINVDSDIDIEDDVFPNETNIQSINTASVGNFQNRTPKTNKNEIECSCSPSTTRLSNQNCYQRHLSKLLTLDSLYLKFSENFLSTENYRLVENECKSNLDRERSFEHVVKVFQVNADLTKEEVDKFLQKEGKHDYIQKLKQHISTTNNNRR